MTSGIAVDNYKVKKFTEDLNAAGFTKIETSELAKDITLMRVDFETKDLARLTKVICLLNAFFELKNKQSN